MLYPGRLTENRFNFAADIVGPLQRSCFGQLQIYIEESLVLIGQKTGRNLLCEKECRRSETKQNDQGNPTAANEGCRDLDIYVSSSTKKIIEPLEELSQQPFVLRARTQQKRTERGTKCQRIEGRDHDRHGDRYGKLLIEPPRDSRDKCGRNEDRRQCQGDPDHRTCDLLHRLECRLLRG